ncbi:hypothetical protein A33M_2952 [Rhodovulum sp. PH10]|uniref:hypothetical protein n=1 Tax=Rhodovulum sp. PH10 TaxID=1187851 RepID=UPI00027C2C2D|nr:hypothetical protein [Rhodovulum sp. PH10]EJW11649.1 hypothetical protein A33M_2952 [Rhodovulum sp. PH10]
MALPLLLAATVVGALALAGSHAFEAGTRLVNRDDPVALADQVVRQRLDAATAHREIEAALAAEDVDLAKSFVDLARSRGVSVDPGLLARVAAADTPQATAERTAKKFGQGLFTGEPDDAASLAGTLAGDLFVFGDVRDAAREGIRMAYGEEADELVLGLACVGIAVTAGTWVSLGAMAPVRAGLSVVKGAWRTGKLTGRMALWLGRSLRGVVDLGAARKAVSGAAWLHPAAAVRGLRAAVKAEKADGLKRFVSDVGRVQGRAGTRAALDGLNIAEGPKDVARIAKLAEKEGGRTRAILKLGGRAAIALTVGAMNLASWVIWALLSVVGFLSTVKSLTERVTRKALHRAKRRRAKRAARLVARTTARTAGLAAVAAALAAFSEARSEPSFA